MKKTILAISMTALVSTSANATGWKGTGEAGILINSGNSDTENINVGLGFEKAGPLWSHTFGLGITKSTSDDVDTANSNTFAYLAKRSLSERSFIFAGLNYLDDDFDGFTEQKGASIGYGYHVIASDKVTFDLGIGIGYRDTSEAILIDDIEVEGKDLSGETLVGLMTYRNKITDNTEFYDTLRLEPGSENTFMENEIGLLVNMNEAYALKASILTRRNSDPAPDAEKTDTITSFNLVYNFGN